MADSAECFMVAARSISTIRPSFEAKYLRSSAEVCLEDGRFLEDIRLMLEAFALTDAEMAELAIARYLTGHTPLPWCVQLCHCIHQNMLEKISSAEKLFKLPEKGMEGDDRLNGS